jgi:tetratricopeptide (TPR) repeat protein
MAAAQLTLAELEDLKAAGEEVGRLIDARDFSAALAYADSATGPRRLVRHLRAYTYTHAGRELEDADVLVTAIGLWEEALAEPGNRDDYNLANAELNLWEQRVKEAGFVAALEGHRDHLHRARALYAAIGREESFPDELRVQALTNVGNSFDLVGRSADAIKAYEKALALDPAFGMALGNKGIALIGIAPLMHEHVAAGLLEAQEVLDRALADGERVVHIGGKGALAHFQRRRASIKLDGDGPSAPSPEWADPFWRWCADHGLFLHVSPRCIGADAETYDPLFFRGMTVGIGDEDQRRMMDLFDAFNAVKQDYAAARYLLWLASGEASPIRAHAAAVSAKGKYLDSLRYANWGARTGLGTQAFAAATNLLDKVACFVHMYFETDRKIQTVTFRNLWHRPKQRNKPFVMDEQLAVHLAPGKFNRGLSALCDLSCDLEQDTSLNELIERRHTATHRFLTVHSMLIEEQEGGGGWLEQVSWSDLIDGTLSQLATARSALIYLAWMIDISERSSERSKPKPGGVIPPLPIFPAETEHPEFD